MALEVATVQEVAVVGEEMATVVLRAVVLVPGSRGIHVRSILNLNNS